MAAASNISQALRKRAEALEERLSDCERAARAAAAAGVRLHNQDAKQQALPLGPRRSRLCSSPEDTTLLRIRTRRPFRGWAVA